MKNPQTSPTTITAILFDFGGVLAEEGFRNGLLALASEQGLNTNTIVDAGMQAVYDSGFVLGTGNASDFWALMKQRTGIEGDDDTLSRQIKNGFIIRPGMIQLVKRLRKKGYLTGILSDQTHWLDDLDQRYHFMDAFTRIYNSYYLGKGKRDRTLFLDVANDLQIPPGSILFVDDDEGNVSRAEGSGLRAIHFTDEASFKLVLDEILLSDKGKTLGNKNQYQL
ncbi:HAD family hydrolase [Kaarinaea lacus]